jgi:hypothetical protein
MVDQTGLIITTYQLASWLSNLIIKESHLEDLWADDGPWGVDNGRHPSRRAPVGRVRLLGGNLGVPHWTPLIARRRGAGVDCLFAWPAVGMGDVRKALSWVESKRERGGKVSPRGAEGAGEARPFYPFSSSVVATGESQVSSIEP